MLKCTKFKLLLLTSSDPGLALQAVSVKAKQICSSGVASLSFILHLPHITMFQKQSTVPHWDPGLQGHAAPTLLALD